MSEENFCHAPFNQMMLSPTGQLHPCCYHFGYRIGQHSDSFEQVWNGPKIRKLRREFLAGNPRICRSRIANLKCHENFARYQGQSQLSEIQESPPKRLDLRLNGMCNLKCVMCDVWQQPNGLYNESFLWQEGPQKIFPFLSEIEVLGGEPFIQADTFRLIQEIRSVNEQCRFSFVTNSQFKNWIRVRKSLEGIPIDKIHISVDACSKTTYEAIRKGGDFELLLQNLENFKSLRDQKGFDITASMCVLQTNVHELEAFYDFCQLHGFTAELQFAFYDPSQSSSLLHLSKEKMKSLYCCLQQQRPNDKDYQSYIQGVTRPLAIHLVKIGFSITNE
ncbi:radical SAM protein [Pseudobacteriovorax antillogorgiicola]|uniref:Cyclic pyranopterin phosphate synthase n=1 Tax=Pseudobacteriovorax antillogorgiicola TaxID=1513793 RepID=A0A1Y6C5Y9_9BACT|nr:radical SAM protein [Pseudobacteriovorax antillogorgiicola]TCS49374.1 cyclic pyranopterin phosphate synthase [Pseudobacteriovorax antillogorgiicola]SMF47398.1 cyclic pyranopterin phosphate synthase [Pseudobacteriovorax antillogorgiicola]